MSITDECIGDPELCRGPVIMFYGYPRCAYHVEQRARTEEIARQYDSDCVPSWFDPSYAGERWEDDY